MDLISVGLAGDWSLVVEGGARWVSPMVLFAMIDGDRKRFC